MKLQSVAIAAIFALSGCSAVNGVTARDSEELLAEAGFQRQAQDARPAATGGATAPVRQLTKAADAYEFHDPDFCRCVYVGGEAEYARLQALRTARREDHARSLRSWSPQANSPDRNVWGAWDPEGLDLR